MKKLVTIFLVLVPLTSAAQPILDKAYYNKLRSGCRNNTWTGADMDGCCQSSVDAMEARKGIQHDPVLTVECPEGYSKNMMKCASTYQWCEPLESNSIYSTPEETNAAPKAETK
jgi:hypothetical protein